VKKNSAKRGVGRYTLELFRSILRVDCAIDFIGYVIPGSNLKFQGPFHSGNIPYLRKPSRLNWVVDLFSIPQRITRDRLELFHATDLTLVPSRSRSSLWITVHDLIPYVFWEQTIQNVPRDFAFLLEKFWHQLSDVDRIITSSEFSKQDLKERAGIPEEKISVIYPGCNPEMKPVESKEAGARISSKYGVDNPFLFYVGGTDYRKNIPLMLKAFKKIIDEDYKGDLVLGGETFKMDIPEVRSILALSRKLGIENRLILPGYIPDPDLMCFYSACDYFVFPSMYEGFGLPVLEALKCGARVITSNSSSIPEVAGDCAAYFDPAGEDELVRVFWESRENEIITRERRKKGFRQAERFSWGQAAQQVVDLYLRHSSSEM
jgi:glycosyltransferase involved in cell wall biosynthesis